MAASEHETVAKSVLMAEADGIKETARLIDGEFSAAVTALIKTEGYLIVTGIGKSGHIGRKLSASFASTGTPSFFLHPTEASHGDLGMVRRNCTVLALSNSGESRELMDIFSYCKKNNIKIILITKVPESRLGKLSDHILRIADIPEACSNDLAPTTSSTNALALGDALVVATMQAKGVSRDDFGRHHPGGKLGRRLQTVGDWLMTQPSEAPQVSGDTDMKELILAMSSGQQGCVAVTDKTTGRFAGMVTDGDLRRAITEDFFAKTAEDIMTRNPIIISQQSLMGEVASLFTEKKISNAFVVEAGKVLGLIHLNTLLREGFV